MIKIAELPDLRDSVVCLVGGSKLFDPDYVEQADFVVQMNINYLHNPWPVDILYHRCNVDPQGSLLSLGLKPSLPRLAILNRDGRFYMRVLRYFTTRNIPVVPFLIKHGWNHLVHEGQEYDTPFLGAIALQHLVQGGARVRVTGMDLFYGQAKVIEDGTLLHEGHHIEPNVKFFREMQKNEQVQYDSFLQRALDQLMGIRGLGGEAAGSKGGKGGGR